MSFSWGWSRLRRFNPISEPDRDILTPRPKYNLGIIDLSIWKSMTKFYRFSLYKSLGDSNMNIIWSHVGMKKNKQLSWKKFHLKSYISLSFYVSLRLWQRGKLKLNAITKTRRARGYTECNLISLEVDDKNLRLLLKAEE